jgi:hypothetical protein
MPGDLEWKVFRYNDPNVALALTDQDIRDKKPEPQSIPGNWSPYLIILS